MNSNGEGVMVSRDEALDATKGILIIFLVLHHIVDVGMGKYGIQNGFLALMYAVQRPVALCFFMQCFFIITGMCSNFNRDFKTFLIKQIRTLIFPAFLFELAIWAFGDDSRDLADFLWNFATTGGRYWFITALFCAKMLYWLCSKAVKGTWTLLGIGLVLNAGATLLNYYKIIPDYYFHRQMLDLFLFLAVGNQFKAFVLRSSCAVWPVVAYASCVAIGYVFCGVKLPYVTAGFGTTPTTWLLHLLLAFSGSVTILALGRLAKEIKWLNNLGRMTMIVYFMQGFMLVFLMDAFKGYFFRMDYGYSVALVFVVLATVLAVSGSVAFVMNNSFLRVCLGKPLRKLSSISYNG